MKPCLEEKDVVTKISQEGKWIQPERGESDFIVMFFL